jgi:hypothetical protein
LKSEPVTAALSSETSRGVATAKKEKSMRMTAMIVATLLASPVSASPAIKEMVKRETTTHLGAQWVPTALTLVRLESGFNCSAVGPKTRQGRAQVLFQVMPGSARALGYNPSRLRECHYGLMAGIAHMRLCIKHGVRTHAQMAACHVSGVKGWKRRLNPRAESYKQKYVRTAMR